MQKLQTEYIKPTLKESRNPPLLQLNVACYELDILWQDIWLHKVIIHDQRSLNKIYQKSNERLRHNHVGHQYSYTVFLVALWKEKLIIENHFMNFSYKTSSSIGNTYDVNNMLLWIEYKQTPNSVSEWSVWSNDRRIYEC